MAKFNQTTCQSWRRLSLVLLPVFLTACTTGAIKNVDTQQEQLEEDVSFHSHNMVRDYTDRLAHQLVNNLLINDWDSPLVITSFVAFEHGKQETKRFGRLISESLVGHIQVYGIPVVAAYTASGADNIKSEVKYVLSGILIENERGFVVNARIINADSQQVLSSATTFIPTFVSESL